MKSFESHKSGWLFPFVLPTIICAVDLKLNYTNYFTFQYTSDGFHYYSFLRNILEYGIPYEGPAMEYQLGFHSYITFYLWLIPLHFWNSPLLLLSSVSLLNWISVFFLILFVRKYLSIFFCTLVPVIYLAMPLVSETRNGTMHMFQVDWIAIPIAISVGYAISEKRITPLILGEILLIFNKEEWVLQFPLLLTFFYVVLDEKSFLIANKKTSHYLCLL